MRYECMVRYEWSEWLVPVCLPMIINGFIRLRAVMCTDKQWSSNSVMVYTVY